MKRPILNHTERGQCVYDPFLGSGTVLIACELTERICCRVEIDPTYVDVSISRWQSSSNQVAILHGTSYTFDQLRAQRLTRDNDALSATTKRGVQEQGKEE